MKVLFIGGTGIISSACSRLAVERGIDLYHLNRGQSAGLRAVDGVNTITADIRDPQGARRALADHTWDAVVDWIGFVPGHVQVDLDLFSGRTRQYVFISSASAYQTPPASWPTTETTPLENPVWEYSRNKIACERLLHEAYERSGFPVTIVRPSHTYDRTLLPCEGGYTVVHRMLAGRPIVVHGDGSSLWTLTHHRDFAKGLVGLLGQATAIGEAYHITSDEWLSWDHIHRLVAEAFGAPPPQLVHLPSETIARHHREIGDSLLGDKSHSMLFDNSKIKALVPDFACTIPFATGVREIAEFYRTHPDWCVVDEALDACFDRMIAES